MKPYTVIYWPGLCANRSEYDALWSDQLTLNTSTPDLTSCFQNTVLMWVPCGLLWLMTPVYAVYVAKRPVYHSWTSSSKLSVLKLIGAIALTLMALFSLIYKVAKFDEEFVTAADLSSSVLLLATFVLVTFYIKWCFRKGLQNCGPLFVFWLVLLVADIITVRSQTMMRRVSDPIFICLCIELTLVSWELLLSCFADTRAEAAELTWAEEKVPLLNGSTLPITQKKNPCPKERASIVSKIFFSWVFPKIVEGLRRKLVLSDIWDVMDGMSAQFNYFLFVKHWKKELKKQDSINTRANLEADKDLVSEATDIKAAKKMSQPSIIWALTKAFFPYFSMSCLLVLVSITANFMGPILLRSLISFIEGDEGYSWKGYALAGLMYCVSLTSTLSLQHQFDAANITTIKLRSALVNAVYRKALVVSNAVRRDVTVGYVVNLISVDINVLLRTFMQFNFVWATPLVIVAGMILLWQQIGPSCLAGLVLLLILLPSNSLLLAKKLKKAQAELMELKESRLKLTSQVLNGIKVLKFYAWEPFFETRLKELRRTELLKLRQVILLLSLTFATWLASPFMVTLACFITYTASSPEHVLDAQKTFVSMSIINVMYQPLTAFSQVIGSLVQGYVSLKRIENFLLKDEMEKPLQHASSDTISVKNGTFTWDTEEVPCLKKISLSVGQGQLVAVVGTVGSGKSSLLSALLGEMRTLSGSISMQGSVAYVPQEAWIQNLTLRDNILFSEAMNRKKYEAVLDACALRPDLRIVPGGDMTEIGEKGINLSGGQKQRVSLARAVYNDRDIYLLDDPLSAVDAHVGKQLFDDVIGPTGLLKNKTRLLVTHGISHLPQMDSIIVMKNGRISEVGTYQELLNNNAAFAEFLHEYMAESDGEGENGGSSDQMEPLGSSKEPQTRYRKKKTSTRSGVTMKTTVESEQATRLIGEEETSSGRVNLSVAIYLMKAAEFLFPFLLLASALLFVATQCVTQLWLREWSQDKPINGTQNAETLQLRLKVYGGLAVFQLVSIVGISISIAFGGMKASLNLHSGLLYSVLRSPMSFFDTTPLGRILNRFSRDMDAVDQIIPIYTQIFLSNTVPIVSIIFIVVYTLPISAAVIGPLAFIIIVLQRLYIVVASQLQRIDAVCRSPLYAFFEETMTGASSIRAFGYSKEFTERMEKLLNRSQAAWFEVFSSSRILNASIQVVGTLIPASTAIFGIIYRHEMDSSSLGMAVSFSMQVGLMLTMFVRFMSELEIQIVSVERIKEYSELKMEALWEIPANKPPNAWPNEGAVEFQSYQTRYRPGLELVLKGIDLKILPCEKVGIVGRTGAGKSSLTLALFRLIEADKGVIRIDGEDIGKMGLHDVRGRLSIIPQDPVLFSGTLQFNMDPSGQRSETALWNALEHSHLKTFVASLPDGLHHKCNEGGGNLSVGQRQLVCLARALLRMSKILVLDEATAAVDMETDDLIQSTIRSQFKDCTVITIAHRLNTVMDYDRVIVMKDGHIREFDSPGNLTAAKNSLFHAMLKDANLL